MSLLFLGTIAGMSVFLIGLGWRCKEVMPNYLGWFGLMVVIMIYNPSLFLHHLAGLGALILLAAFGLEWERVWPKTWQRIRKNSGA